MKKKVKEITMSYIQQAVKIRGEEYYVVKVRNGYWRVMRGNKIFSKHSMREGAERMIEQLLSKKI